tara:strand:+ start:1210 stop:1350 length:141 start_codon:yes stop_codon:yes gene_type:complete
LSAFLKKYLKIICLIKFFDHPVDDELEREIILTLNIFEIIIANMFA